MEVDDGLLFLRREVPSFDVGSEIVCPPEPAALATPVEPRSFRERPPAPVPMFFDIISQLLVLFRIPWPFL